MESGQLATGSRPTLINHNETKRTEVDKGMADGIEKDLKRRDDNAYVAKDGIPYALL